MKLPTWLQKKKRDDLLYLPMTMGELRIIYFNFLDLQKPLTLQQSADFNHVRNFKLKF